MKRAISMILATILIFSICGSALAAKPKKALVEINGSTISVRDDGTGESGNNNGLKKTVILTNKNIGYNGVCGPFKFEIQGIQVAKIRATTSSVASVLGIEKGKDAALVGIQLEVENTSDEDITWYPYMSTIVTSDKEQVDSDVFMSDSVGGEFFGNVAKQGQIYFICKNTDADKLSYFQWRVDHPFDEKYNDVGEDLKIKFEFPKD